MKHIIAITVAIALILFVLVPAAFIFLGKVGNPLALTAMSGLTPQYRTSNGVVNNYATTTKSIDCTDERVSYEPHVRDAELTRDDEKSIISSDVYNYKLVLPAPIYDWDYTHGGLQDESVSFVYKETIINILARTSNIDCNTIASKVYKNFHTKNEAVEYFSSRTYVDQGKAIGLQKAVLETYGTETIGDRDYHWYLLEEYYQNTPDHIVATKWYSTRIGRTEYWFAFRAFKEISDQVNDTAHEVLEEIEYDSLF